jgi:hypothetical protein
MSKSQAQQASKAAAALPFVDSGARILYFFWAGGQAGCQASGIYWTWVAVHFFPF